MPTEVSVEELKNLSGEKELGTSDWHRVEQKHIDLFADATGDHQWIHVDQEMAKQGPFGQTIAHGYMTLSLCAPFLADVLQIEGLSLALNYGLDRVRFPAPVPVGTRVRGRARVLTATGIPGGVQVVVRMTVDADGVEKPVCVADLVVRYYA